MFCGQRLTFHSFNFRLIYWFFPLRTATVGFDSLRLLPKTWKNVFAGCAALCLALMDGCKKTIRAQCCHWLATRAAFIAKVAAWPAVKTETSDVFIISSTWTQFVSFDVIFFHLLHSCYFVIWVTKIHEYVIPCHDPRHTQAEMGARIPLVTFLKQHKNDYSETKLRKWK